MITLKYSLFMSNPRRNVTRLDSRIYRAKLFAAPRGKLFDTLHFLTAVNLLLRGLIFIPSHRSKIFFKIVILVGPAARGAATDTVKSL